MAYSFMTAISDGTLKSMPITFNYMKVEDIVVHQNLDRLTSGIDYTISNNVITFKNVVPALDRIAVDRMSQRDSLRVNFVEGATFSRENMDDVLTQMLYLTQEAMEGSVDRISPTGVLDLAGNRIINLGDPVDLQDAVPLHLVVDAEKSVYASEAKCKQYRDEALGYKNEAFTYADRAYASELNAKKSEDNAKASEINAANSASSILGAVEQSAESAAAAKVSETNAKASENKTGAMVDRVEDALVGVEEYNDRVSSLEKETPRRKTKTFYVKGDSSKFYRVALKLPSPMRRVTIYRGYSDTIGGASDPNWNGGSTTHMGAFGLSIFGNNDAWGGDTCGAFYSLMQRYTACLADIQLATAGDYSIHVYLRASPNGDGAKYTVAHYDADFEPTVVVSSTDTASQHPMFARNDVYLSGTWQSFLYEMGARVYSENYKPSPSAIGAVSSSNVVGSIKDGALFERILTPDGWDCTLYADGTIIGKKDYGEKTITLSGTVTNIHLNTTHPFKFITRPTFSCSAYNWSRSSNYHCTPLLSSGGYDLLTHVPTIVLSYGGSAASGSGSAGITVSFVGRVNVDSPFRSLSDDPSTLEEPEVDTPQVLPYDPEI